MRNIKRHRAKLEQERSKPNPSIILIRKWVKDIDRAQKRVREVEGKLAR
jgi:hypothetical protein